MTIFQGEKTCFLILLYNKSISDSKTFNSLMENESLLDNNTCIIIWNNGPYSIDIPIINNIKIKLIQTTDNKSLSYIYNKVIKANKAERYVILDDDSCLNSLYMKDIYKISVDQVGVPEIWSNSEKVSPRYRNKVNYEKSIFNEKYEFMSIGSGLVIGKNIIEKFKNEFDSIFDERFVFYGVDTSFFFRLRILKLYSKIEIISGFNHSLSKLDKNGQSLFRIKERSYDMALSNKYYNNAYKRILYNSRVFMSFFLQKIRGKTPLYSLKYYIEAYKKGYHYRYKINE